MRVIDELIEEGDGFNYIASLMTAEGECEMTQFLI